MSYFMSRSTIDGRTLLVLVRWAHVIVDEYSSSGGLDETDKKELLAAINNVAIAMEHVFLEVVPNE